MKNKFTLWFILIGIAFLPNSCMQESFLLDNENKGNQRIITILKLEHLKNEPQLLKAVSEIQSKLKADRFLSGKNGSLEEAIIGTREVVLVENNGHKTYTFPVFRTYLSNKTENLVLKKNEDGTFSGMLMEYDVTREEMKLYNSGHDIDIWSNLKVSPINNLQLNTAAKENYTYTMTVGCMTITYETGMCSENIHESGHSGTCTAAVGAPPIKIVAIEIICPPESGGGQGNGGGYYPPMAPGESYDTFPSVSADYQYYATEDLNDPNYMHWQKVNQYFSALPASLIELSGGDIFYYSFFYFKDHGVNAATKAFITERLTHLYAWYTTAKGGPNASQIELQYRLNWAFKYLVTDHPDMTWEQFYNQFLTTPCEKLQNLLDPAKANLKPLITNGMYSYINDSSSGEAGINLKKDADGNISSVVLPYTADGKISIKAGVNNYAAIHTHPNDGYPMFSWYDVYVLYTLEMNAAPHNNGQSCFMLVCQDDNGVKQTYAIVFENMGTFVEDTLNPNIPDNIGCTQQELIDKMNDALGQAYHAESRKVNPNYERVFLQFNFGTNISLYKINPDLTGWSKLSINTNLDTAIVNSTNCN